MDREKVKKFILTEVKRLNEEEGILKLCKDGKYEELSKVVCRTSNAINRYLYENKLCLKDCEIPIGYSLGLAIWVNTIYVYDAIEDEWSFARQLAEEAGRLGKSLAYKLEQKDLANIQLDEFFDDSDAEKYNPD